MTDQRHYLLEFLPMGNSVKVSAIDPVSGTEVSIVGPVNASKDELTRVAVSKLEYVMREKSPDKSLGKDKGVVT